MDQAQNEKAALGQRGSSEGSLLGSERPEDSALDERPQADRYPLVPGWRKGPNAETSREGAALASATSATLKNRILDVVAISPRTPEELVDHFAAQGETRLLNTIRARCSDLHALGLLTPSGTYGRGESGKVRTIRWRRSTPLEQATVEAERAAKGGSR